MKSYIYDECGNMNGPMIRYVKNILYNYYTCIRFIQNLEEENKELKERIADECKAKGISYDKESVSGGGKSSSGTPTKTYANELVLQQSTVEIKLKEYRKALSHIKEDNKIKEMLSCLTKQERVYITMIFKQNYSEMDVARKKNVSSPYVHKTVNNIIVKMINFRDSL